MFGTDSVRWGDFTSLAGIDTTFSESGKKNKTHASTMPVRKNNRTKDFIATIFWLFHTARRVFATARGTSFQKCVPENIVFCLKSSSPFFWSATLSFRFYNKPGKYTSAGCIPAFLVFLSITRNATAKKNFV
jgi:hypothetical protein